MDGLFKAVTTQVSACAVLESLITGKGYPKPPKQRIRKSTRCRNMPAPDTPGQPPDAKKLVKTAVKRCREQRNLVCGNGTQRIDDATLFKRARFTDSSALKPFAPFLHYVPRLVNVVTVCDFVSLSRFFGVEARYIACIPCVALLRSWPRRSPLWDLESNCP